MRFLSRLPIRRNHVNQRTDIKNHIRGILKLFGIRLGSIGPTRFGEAVKQCIQNQLDPLLRTSIEEQLEIFDALTQKICEFDRKLLSLAKQDKETRLLLTAHGVGPIIALTYKAEIFDPTRFKKSRTVGAYLGMTPTQYSSGEIQKQGRISKYGSTELRALLTEAGVVILTRSQKWSRLKAWGLKLMRKKGLQKAALAVGRKLAVIMHQMLVKQQEFVWGNPPVKTA